GGRGRRASDEVAVRLPLAEGSREQEGLRRAQPQGRTAAAFQLESCWEFTLWNLHAPSRPRLCQRHQHTSVCCIPYPAVRVLLFLPFAAIASAAPLPDSAEVPFTAKELAQGFREHVILARPREAHRATVDAAEAREAVRVRETFPRFRDLRIIE